MKRILILATLLSASCLASAQIEPLPREQALKYAFAASLNLKEMQNTPIPTDPDVKRPVAIRNGEYGSMILPETKLTSESLAKVDKDTVPVGQLWLLKLAPLTDGQVVSSEKLRMVEVNSDEGHASVPLCALGVARNSQGALELQVFGKDKQPVLKIPLKTISITQQNPIEMEAEETGDGGQITLKILGKYQASFMVTDPDRY